MQAKRAIAVILRSAVSCVPPALVCALLLLANPRGAGSRTERVILLPKLRAGQTITYEIRFRLDKNIRTQSTVVSPLGPSGGLVWLKRSSYVRDEPCPAAQLTMEGRTNEADRFHETCAVILTTAALKQESSRKNATPEDFKLHELQTTGTARGTNQVIAYISLKTGLVVGATEEASQSMDVVVAKTDGTNRVHYNVDAKSNSEVLLVAERPLAHP